MNFQKYHHYVSGDGKLKAWNKSMVKDTSFPTTKKAKSDSNSSSLSVHFDNWNTLFQFTFH